MKTGWRYALAAIGAGALVGSVASTAFAGRVASVAGDLRVQAVKRTTIGGQLYVNDVVHANKNMSVYGHLYAHNGEQVWKGLIVKQGASATTPALTVNSGGLVVQAGGIKSDALAVAGPITATDGTFSGNLSTATLQATGTINGTTLNLNASGTGTGTITTAGTITAGGKVSGNGVDAGAGGLTTTGNISTTGTVSAGTLSGSLSLPSGANITTNGAITAGTLGTQNLNATGTSTLANVTVSGTLNLASGAHLTGVDLSQLLSGGSIPSLTVGASSATAPPFIVSQNGQTAQVGVSAANTLSLSNLNVGTNATIGGALTVNGALTANGTFTPTGGLTIPSTANLTASTIQGTPSGGNPGALTINTSGLTINGVNSAGTVTLGAGVDLALASGSSPANTHIISNGDTDVAGTASVTVGTSNPGSNGFTQNVSLQSYGSSNPIVVVTPTDDPTNGGVGGSGAPRVWVTASSTQFTIHVIPATLPASSYPITFNYHVIGS